MPKTYKRETREAPPYVVLQNVPNSAYDGSNRWVEPTYDGDPCLVGYHSDWPDLVDYVRKDLFDAVKATRDQAQAQRDQAVKDYDAKCQDLAECVKDLQLEQETQATRDEFQNIIHVLSQLKRALREVQLEGLDRG